MNELKEWLKKTIDKNVHTLSSTLHESLYKKSETNAFEKVLRKIEELEAKKCALYKWESKKDGLGIFESKCGEYFAAMQIKNFNCSLIKFCSFCGLEIEEEK